MGLTKRAEGTALLQDSLQIELSQVVQGMSKGLNNKTWQLINFGFCSIPVEATCKVRELKVKANYNMLWYSVRPSSLKFFSWR